MAPWFGFRRGGVRSVLPALSLPALPCLVAAALMATGGHAEELRPLTGELLYRERIALPPDATVIVEARGWQDTLLAESAVASDGRQVPLPFELAVPAGVAARVTAGIRLGGRPRWVSDTVAVAAGTAPAGLGTLMLKAVEPLLFPSTYRCGEQEIRVGVLDDNAVMEIGAERFTLVRAISGSGARYEAEGDRETFFWSKGKTAFVSLRGERLAECRRVARAAPQPYVARGHDPDWSLEVGNGAIRFVPGIGAEPVEAQLPAAKVEGGSYVVDLAAPAMRIVLTETTCRDSATGMPHPDSVTVEFGGAAHAGCGGDPLGLLTRAEWVVEDIGGGGIIDSSHLTLVFDGAGRVAGSGGCNSYNGAVTLTGEGLSFGPAAATMKACSEALMMQEQRFFRALTGVGRFDIDPVSGALLLIGPGEAVALRATRHGG